jgi:hypothetical protein
MMISFLGFVFASYVPELEVKKPETLETPTGTYKKV